MVNLSLILLNCGVVLRNLMLVFGDLCVCLLDLGGYVRNLCLQVGNLRLQILDFERKFSAELENLVNLGVNLLKRVQGLQFLPNADIGVCKTFLNGDEGLPLVDRGLYFLSLFSHIA